jgi:hypothetical protein
MPELGHTTYTKKQIVELIIASFMINVATLALGSQPKRGLTRAWAKREAWECGRV